ncbi:MAG: diguanylate cyclase domain-containing protein [Thermogutta sp.]
MLLWSAFVAVITLNLILGIAFAIWVKREIDTSEGGATTLNSDSFSDIKRVPADDTNPEGLVSSHQTSPDGQPPQTGEDEGPFSPASSEGDMLPEDPKQPTAATEVFGLSPPDVDQVCESSQSQLQSASADLQQTFEYPQDGEQSPVNSAADTDDLVDSTSGTPEHLPSGSPDEESISTADPQAESEEETIQGGDGLGLSQLLETCSKTISGLINLFERTRAQPIVKAEELKTILDAAPPLMEQFSDEYHYKSLRLTPVAQGGAVLDETLACLQEHTLAAEQSLKQLTLIDHRGDPQVTLQQVQAELGRLISRVQRIRDELESAFAQVLLNAHGDEEIDKRIQHDPLTGALNRIGLEAFFEQYWGSEVHSRAPLLGGLLDLDQFRQINQEFGYPLGNKVLKAIAGLIQELIPRGAVFARYRGDQFLVLKSDCDARQFVRAMEQIRQSLEVAKFQQTNRTISVTLSCGVTESRTDDMATSFCERLDEAVYEAKRTGGNRTFVHNGEFAQSIVPLNLKVTEREVSLAAIE